MSIENSSIDALPNPLLDAAPKELNNGINFYPPIMRTVFAQQKL
jgi:hypothetical protein